MGGWGGVCVWVGCVHEGGVCGVSGSVGGLLLQGVIQGGKGGYPPPLAPIPPLSIMTECP